MASADSDGSQTNPKPRRLTRSSSKHQVEQPITEPVKSDEPIIEEMTSGGSTPTQDEQPIIDSLVVLSDICSKTERLPTPEEIDMDISDESRPGSSTPVQDEEPISKLDTQAMYEDITPSISSEKVTPAPSNQATVSITENVVDSHNQPVLDPPAHLDREPTAVAELVSADNTQPPESDSKENSLFEDTYEPELHFDQISAEVTHETTAAPSVRSDDATPTLDEPASPDRFTESPTSPTPGSPTTEGLGLHQSSSMVTIPLDGDDEYIRDSASGTPTLPSEITPEVEEPTLILTESEAAGSQPSHIPVMPNLTGKFCIVSDTHVNYSFANMYKL